ncbi:oligosaccharide flippase family protein [Rosettibacter firmus]|uniref:oligosaccharide flippase family protein n=1 Tax=Rosettibacter firmus TaxID=3111522 RepID=UPI00336BE9DE
MTVIKKLRNNSFLSFLSILSRLIPNFLIFLFVARIYRPYEFGMFSYAHTLSNTFLLIADFGFDVLLTTEIAKNKNRVSEIVSEYLISKIVFVIVAIISMSTFIFLKSDSISEIILGFVFLIYMVFNSFSNFMISIIKGLEKFHYETTISVIMNLSLLLLSFIFIYTTKNIFLVGLAYGISRLFAIISSKKFIRKEVAIKFVKFNKNDFIVAIKKNIVFGSLVILNNLLYQLDTLFLGVLKDNYNVGIYQSVKNLMFIPFIIPGIIYNSFLPTMSRLFKENNYEWFSSTKLFFKLTIILSMIISVISFSYPEEIIHFFYSNKNYNESIIVLKVAAFVMFLRIISDFFGVMLITTEKFKKHIFTSSLGILISIILFYVLIPKYNALGTMLSYLIMIIVVLIMFIKPNYNIFLKKILDARFLFVVLYYLTIILLFNFHKMDFVIGITFILISFSLILMFIFYDKVEFNLFKRNILFLGKSK